METLEKPHRGRLEDWYRHPLRNCHIICGKFVGHPEFDGHHGHTSIVVDYFTIKGEQHVETLNSVYALGAPRKPVQKSSTTEVDKYSEEEITHQ